MLWIVTHPRRRLHTRLGSLCLLCLAATGCGGSSGPAPAKNATALCRDVQAKMVSVLGQPVAVRIANHDPANTECVLTVPGTKLDVVAQASPQAWTQYDTTVVHQSQAFGGKAGSSSSNLAVSVAGLGYNASWIPSQQQLVATNGTQSTGGSYVTVTVTRSSKSKPSNQSLAEAAATRTLAVAPKGPNPGPPPS
jgi:hypothetical protein